MDENFKKSILTATLEINMINNFHGDIYILSYLQCVLDKRNLLNIPINIFSFTVN